VKERGIFADRKMWIAASFVLAAISAYYFQATVLGPIAKPGLPVLGSVPEFSLTERSGLAVTRQDLEDTVWIAGFIFTRCSGVCPRMAANMRMLQEKLADAPGVKIAAFSVDPEYDTPEVLQEYARRFKADPKKWLFLTGDKETIYRLSSQHFHLGVGEIPPEEREAADQAVQHSSKFALIDGRGQIRGYYSGENSEGLDQLASDARGLQRAS
jgi:protein SCO1